MAPDIFPLWLQHVGVTSTHLKYLCSPLINLPVAIKSLLTSVNKDQLFNNDEEFPSVAFSTVALHVVHEIVPLLEVWDTFRKREVFEKKTSILKLHIDIHTHYAVIALTIIKSSCWRLFEKTNEWINHFLWMRKQRVWWFDAVVGREQCTIGADLSKREREDGLLRPDGKKHRRMQEMEIFSTLGSLCFTDVLFVFVKPS